MSIERNKELARAAIEI
jgi:predicted ester cyclase